MEKTIGVVGAGVMGTGVSQLFAQYGYGVVLVDIAKTQLDVARNKILENLRYKKIINKTVLKEEVKDILNRIHFTTDYSYLKDMKFIVENITENCMAKKALYLKLNNICPTECIFGVNTSAISITKIASFVVNPSRVIGMHFMNPVPMMPMVELIKGFHTSEATIQMVQKLLITIERKFTLVNDSVGFVTNRAMMIFVNEAIFMVQENVASVEEIDTLFRQCFGHKMGPLQTADLIGLDTILYSLEVLYEGFNDSKYRPCWLLKKMVDAGLHGVKSKKGFYNYA